MDEEGSAEYHKYHEIVKKVNAWAAISDNSKSCIKIFTQNMDSEFYCGVLMKKLSEIKEIGGEDMMFQCDNDSKHVSKMAMEFYKKNKLKNWSGHPTHLT